MQFKNAINIVSKDGSFLGVLNKKDIYKKIINKRLECIEVFIKKFKPVCKIINFGKHRYNVIKKKHSSQKKNFLGFKEIKLRPNIADRDLYLKIKSINKIVFKGNKVKVSMSFKGRELQYYNVGFSILSKIKENVKKSYKLVPSIIKSENQLYIIIIP